jgi:hypothetical protein
MGEHRGQKLRSPEDVRRAIQRVSNKIFKEGSEVENAGRLAQLYNVFLKAYEIEKLENVERRLSALEGAKDQR